MLPNFLYCFSNLYLSKSIDSKACFFASLTSGEYFSASSQTVSFTFSLISSPDFGAYRTPATIPPITPKRSPTPNPIDDFSLFLSFFIAHSLPHLSLCICGIVTYYQFKLKGVTWGK